MRRWSYLRHRSGMEWLFAASAHSFVCGGALQPQGSSAPQAQLHKELRPLAKQNDCAPTKVFADLSAREDTTPITC